MSQQSTPMHASKFLAISLEIRTTIYKHYFNDLSPVTQILMMTLTSTRVTKAPMPPILKVCHQVSAEVHQICFKYLTLDIVNNSNRTLWDKTNLSFCIGSKCLQNIENVYLAEYPFDFATIKALPRLKTLRLPDYNEQYGRMVMVGSIEEGETHLWKCLLEKTDSYVQNIFWKCQCLAAENPTITIFLEASAAIEIHDPLRNTPENGEDSHQEVGRMWELCRYTLDMGKREVMKREVMKREVMKREVMKRDFL